MRISLWLSSTLSGWKVWRKIAWLNLTFLAMSAWAADCLRFYHPNYLGRSIWKRGHHVKNTSFLFLPAWACSRHAQKISKLKRATSQAHFKPKSFLRAGISNVNFWVDAIVIHRGFLKTPTVKKLCLSFNCKYGKFCLKKMFPLDFFDAHLFMWFFVPLFL